MNNVAIIQARISSSRLPGKVLMPVGNTSLMGQVIRRVQAIPSVTSVCVAVPDQSCDNEVAIEAEHHGCIVYRGPELDVLRRYYEAAKLLNADNIIRITADCPIIDPLLSEAILQLHIHSNVDYTCNNMPPTWPHGTEVECFTMSMLEWCHYNSINSFQREHVTVLMRYHEDVNRINLINNEKEQCKLRWTVDEQKDYEFMRALFKICGPYGPKNLQNTIDILQEYPELTNINSSLGYYQAAEPDVPSKRVYQWSPLEFQDVIA